MSEEKQREGDLQGTLKLLQESFATLWTLDETNATYDTPSSREQGMRVVGPLIATAVQQAEALPKPQPDLAAWQEKAQIILADVLDLLSSPMPAVGSREAFARSRACKLKAHLAAMPAQRDVNEGLLKALTQIQDWALVAATEARAAIAVAEKGAS